MPAAKRGAHEGLLKPPAIQPGAGIGVIAPASFAQPERVERGLASLKALDFAPKLGDSALQREPLFFAGTLGSDSPTCMRPSRMRPYAM